MRGRPPTRKKGAYTPAERARNYRRRLKRLRPDPKTVAKQRRRAERETALAEATFDAWRRLDGLHRLFPVLCLDWPWRIEPYSRETGMDRAADNHYPTMGLVEIKAKMARLPAARDCAAFIWMSNEYLDEIKDICEAGGFKYRANCIWTKTGKPPGMGYWYRYNHEILVVATRGSIPCPAPGLNWPAEIEAPWEGHSRKPEVFADMIADYFPNLPKLEMFYRAFDDPDAERARRARREAAGWHVFGNEAEEAAA
jgi:N6-adenosine-specific RNA methylase IME4